MLSETDLYSLVENETFALAMEFSPDWKLLAIYARDCKVRVFHFSSGRLLSIIDESLTVLSVQQEQQEFDSLVFVES